MHSHSESGAGSKVTWGCQFQVHQIQGGRAQWSPYKARSGEFWRQRRSVLWTVRSSVVQVREDFGDLQWQTLRESTAAVRTFGVLSGESYRRSPPRFFHGVNSRPRGFADLGDGVTQVKLFLPSFVWLSSVLGFHWAAAASYLYSRAFPELF